MQGKRNKFRFLAIKTSKNGFSISNESLDLDKKSSNYKEIKKHIVHKMGCMTIKQNSSIQRRRSGQQLDINDFKDFAFHIEPPSDCLSSISNLSAVLQKNPEILFRKTDVGCCFVHTCGEVMPLRWNYTQNGFQIFKILQQNFKNGPQDIDLRRVKHNDY